MLKNKITATTTCYESLALKDAIDGISKAGLSYIEFMATKQAGLPTLNCNIIPEEMENFEIESLRKQLKDNSLELVALSGHTDVTKLENVPHIKACIDVVKKLGGKFVCTGANGDNSQTAVRQFYRNMEELSEYAVEKGITICLETHQIIYPNGKEVAKAIQKINSKGVKMCYDTGNVIFYSGVKLEEDLKYALPYLGIVQLKDKIGGKDIYNFPPLGDGSIDYLPLLNMIIKSGYSGPFTIEIEWQRDTKRTIEMVNQGVKKSYDYLRNLFSKLSY